MKQCFGVAPPPRAPSDPALCDRVENVLRSKILHKTHRFRSERKAFLNGFKFVDPKDLGHISVHQFKDVLERFGLWLPIEECAAVFQRYAEDVDGEPRLRYAAFVKQFLSPDMPYNHNLTMSDNHCANKMDFG